MKERDEQASAAEGAHRARRTLVALAAVALAVLAVLGRPILRGEAAVLANPYATPPFAAAAPDGVSARTFGKTCAL